jgi:hypothetical protein
VAVRALLQVGQTVTYDDQGDGLFQGEFARSRTRLLFGDATSSNGHSPSLVNDFLRRATAVRLHIDNVDEALPHLKQLPYLRFVYVYQGRVCSQIYAPEESRLLSLSGGLVGQLPNVEVRGLSGFVATTQWPAGWPEHDKM